jgi:hypothetical protein
VSNTVAAKTDPCRGHGAPDGPSWGARHRKRDLHRAQIRPASDPDSAWKPRPVPPGGQRTISPSGQNGPVDLARIGWIVTVLACLIAVLILVLQAYYGYALVTFAVAVSAAFNLT